MQQQRAPRMVCMHSPFCYLQGKRDCTATAVSDPPRELYTEYAKLLLQASALVTVKNHSVSAAHLLHALAFIHIHSSPLGSNSSPVTARELDPGGLCSEGCFWVFNKGNAAQLFTNGKSWLYKLGFDKPGG